MQAGVVIARVGFDCKTQSMREGNQSIHCYFEEGQKCAILYILQNSARG